ncbi:MAG TPA: CmcJ/NvfI family oxidoreductase [Pseudomonadales bacterium]|nr:CmcJ/NvfI family oxidoreductase [Pseudomonadales bacterium]
MTTAAPSRPQTAAIAVEAELNYLLDTGARPVSYTFEPPPGVPRYSGIREAQRVIIRNGRLPEYARAFSLDATGFELRHHETAVEDFDDEKAIRDNYYPEAEDLIKRATGAVKVVVFDHTLRDGAPNHGRAGVREPVRAVHNDQTFVSGPRRVRDHLPPDEASQRLQKRFAILNLWRPLGRPVEQSPLAVCDARTIAFGDLVPSDLVYPDKVGETYAVKYNPRHLWYYFPNMTPSEVLLLKIFDSRTHGTARATAHTAFEDPTAPPTAAPRRSIELRTLVFWDN